MLPYARFNSAQESTLRAVATGRDVLTRQPTGSGKTLAAVIPGARAWIDGLQLGESCLPPLTVVYVPWRALGFDMEREIDEYLAWVFSEGLSSIRGRALFVDRGAAAVAAAAATAAATRADVDVEARGGGASTPSSAPSVTVADGRPLAVATGVVVGVESVSWEQTACRFVWPEEKASWCKFCTAKKQQGTKRVEGCITRKDRLRAAAGEGGGAGDGGGGGVRTRRSLGGGEEARVAEEGGGAEGGAEGSGGGASSSSSADAAVLRLADLRRDAPERRIGEDRSMAFLIMTPEAAASTSERGALLRRELVVRGRVQRFVVDEAHAVLASSDGGAREACAGLGVTVRNLRAAIEDHGGGPTQLLAQSATIPPAFEPEALRRLRLGGDAIVVRGSVDRPTISFARVFLPELSESETAASYAVRAWQHAVRRVAAALLEGHKLLFVTRADMAPILAARLEMAGIPATSYCGSGSGALTDEQRQANFARWRGDAEVVMVATSSFGAGINLATVRFVMHLGLARAGDAARHLLRALNGEPRRLLSELLDHVPVGAPPPFDGLACHRLLVLRLVSSRRLPVSIKVGSVGQHVIFVSGSQHALDALELQGEELFILLPRALLPGAKPVAAATVDADGAETARAAQTVATHVAEAMRHLQVARHSLAEAADGGVDIAALGLSLEQLSLLQTGGSAASGGP